MHTITLNNNQTIPTIGLGTWRSEKENLAPIIQQAIDLGYRHIDCASIYGNEREIGEGLQNVLATKKVSREELFVTSKLWNTDHHPQHVEAACRQTLKDLQLDYLDLYLVHWGIAFAHGEDLEPMGDNGLVKTEPVSHQETWRAMEQLVEKGLVRSIGVANFTAPMLIDLLSYAKIQPSMNQIEIHPYNSQEKLVEYCHKQNIAVTAYSPLGSSGGTGDKPITNPIVLEIASSLHKTPAQVLIKWSIQRGLIAIPKSTNEQRLATNLDVYSFKLSPDDMQRLNGLNKNHRFVDPIAWWGVPYFA